MRLKKSFQLALNILFHSKLRSWLTIIGIVIGIGAVVAIVSMSQGATEQLESRLGSLGADILTITSGGGKATGNFGFQGGGSMPREGPGGTTESTGIQKNLTNKDINIIKTLNNVEYVIGQVSGKEDVSYGSKTLDDNSCTGVDTLVWKEITTSTIISGRLLASGDTYSVVIGERIAESSFDSEISINSKLTIGGKSFNVVGIFDGSGIYMPLDIARDVLEDVGDDEFDSILVKIEDVEISDETVDLITDKLMLSRGILDEKKVDFSISNPSAMQETMSETMDTMSLFLGAIAAISLLVGAIGIANSMFTSVLEKTRDIGIMKSIGAKNKDILSIFLLNSGLIGLVGGIGGVIIGFFASAIISNIAGTSSTNGMGGGMMGMFGSTYVSPEIVISALLISVVVGMIAGVIPAYRASKLNPVDALRYE